MSSRKVDDFLMTYMTVRNVNMLAYPIWRISGISLRLIRCFSFLCRFSGYNEGSQAFMEWEYVSWSSKNKQDLIMLNNGGKNS